jgi:hypothetical protein
MAFETYKKEQAEEAERLAKEEVLEKGDSQTTEKKATLTEIMDDKEKEPLFGKMLENISGGKELMMRLENGELTRNDMDDLDAFRSDFLERYAEAEGVNLLLTPEIAKLTIARNPDFAQIANLLGGERTIDFVREHMKELAVTGSLEFGKIMAATQNVKSFENGEMKALDEMAKGLAKENGFDAGAYEATLAMADGEKRSEALTKMIHDSWGKTTWGSVKSAFDFGGVFSKETVGQMETQKKVIDAALAELNKRKTVVGEVLGASVKGNKELLAALSREITGKKKEKAPTIKESREIAPDGKKIVEMWKAKKKKAYRNWDAMPEDEKDEARDGFLSEVKYETDQDYPENGGFWANIFKALFEALIDGFDKAKLA